MSFLCLQPAMHCSSTVLFVPQHTRTTTVCRQPCQSNIIAPPQANPHRRESHPLSWMLLMTRKVPRLIYHSMPTHWTPSRRSCYYPEVLTRNATEVYESIHPPSAPADNLPSEKKLGPVDPTTVSLKTDTPPFQVTNVKQPPLTQMISLLDFEVRDLFFISSSSNFMVIQGRGTRSSLS
jgi:hypothetical protein